MECIASRWYLGSALANNLGRQLGANEWLMLGIVDDIPLRTLEQWAKPTQTMPCRMLCKDVP